MKSSRLFFTLSLLTIAQFLTGCTLPAILTKKNKAALQVNATPKSTVFLNDNHLGQTPYFDENLKPGELTIKLVPESGVTLLESWQGVVKLSAGILTVVNRSFGKTEEESSGYILSLEPTTEKEKVRLSVISTPDSVIVNFDSEPQGFTPLAIADIPEGEHTLIVSSPGYEEQTINAKAIKGHNLMINVQLAKMVAEEPIIEIEATASAKPSASPSGSPKTSPKASPKPSASPNSQVLSATTSAEPMERPYVKIKATPTGFLNVRSEPSIVGKEKTILTRIYPGEVYKFIEANLQGWYRIEYKTGSQGWIFSEFATLYQ